MTNQPAPINDTLDTQVFTPSSIIDPSKKAILKNSKIKKILYVVLALLFMISLILIFNYIFLNNFNTVKTKRTDVNDNVNEKTLTINMIGHWKGEDLREDFVLETIKEFELKNPNTKVNIKWNLNFPEGREGALKATVDQIQTDHIEWDVIWLEPFYYQQIASTLNDQNWGKNNLVDFEKITGFSDSQKSFIISDPQYRNQMNGMITGPYIEGFYQPFFYNKDLANKIGLQIKDKGMTYNDLLGYFKAIFDYNTNNGTDYTILYDSGDATGGIGYGPSTWNIFQSLFRSEFPEFSLLKSTEPSTEKLAAVRKVLGSLEELSKYKPLIKGYEDLKWFDTRYYVLEDKAVFTAAGASWMYSHWRGIDKDKTMKIIPIEMPVYQEIDYYMGGYNPMFAVMNRSSVKDEAVELLMNFSTPSVAEKWVRYAKGPSGIKGNVSESGNSSLEGDQYDKFISYITNKYGGNVFDSKTVDYVLGSKYKNLTTFFCQELVAVLDGKMTAGQAYSSIINQMQTVK